MQAPVKHIILGKTFWLSAERCIFWEDEKTLIISDLHLGKTGHFRKAGIAVPQTVYKEDLQRLINLIHYFKPEKMIVVGDFFHSHANLELNLFQRWRSDFSYLQIDLVKGNHDILKESWYKETEINLLKEDLQIGDFKFTHEHCHPENNGEYVFCGHIHPGIIVKGLGKQALRFPCFYFNHTYCILPAFGKFTGLATIEPKSNDKVYAIVEDSIIKMQ